MFRLVASLNCLAFLLWVSGCRPEAAFETTQAETAKPFDQVIETKQKVDFRGVSFLYDTSVFGDVRTELIPEYKLEEADLRPDGVAPECICFTFELGEEHRKAVVKVYPLARFPAIYVKDKRSVALINEQIAGLRRVIEDKNDRLGREIPHLLFVDAHQDFQCKVQRFSFQNGNGVLFVMHWDIELNLISNRNLIYRYEGITSYGNFYVTAEMPIKVPFLPAEPPNEFEGFRVYDDNGYTMDALDDEKVLNYRESISQRLETLPNDEFGPKLKYFEDLISSLSIAEPKR